MLRSDKVLIISQMTTNCRPSQPRSVIWKEFVGNKTDKSQDLLIESGTIASDPTERSMIRETSQSRDRYSTICDLVIISKGFPKETEFITT